VLYEKQQVLIPPPPLVRAILEHCAHVLWLLQPGGDVDDRLARAYLERLFSAVERKKTSGRLPAGTATSTEPTRPLKHLRQQASDAFGERVPDEEGQHTLRGQRMPGLTDCVALALDLLKQGPSWALRPTSRSSPGCSPGRRTCQGMSWRPWRRPCSRPQRSSRCSPLSPRAICRACCRGCGPCSA